MARSLGRTLFVRTPVPRPRGRATVPAMRLLWTTPARWPALGIAVFGLLLLSCGKKPPKSAETDPAAKEQQAGELAAEAEDTSPLEPAPAPAGVFLRARVKSPGSLLAAVGDAASSPLDLRRLLTEADSRVRQVLERVVDIDGPAEALVALHPVSSEEPMAVWSVSARGVRSALQGLETEGIDTKQGPEGLHYFELSGESCALGRSLGQAPARILCADRAESLDSLQAYALRGLPTESLGDSAVALRVVAEPLQRQYGKQLRGLRLLAGVGARQLHRDSPRFDNAVSEALLGLVDELVAIGEDVEGLRFDLWDREGAFESELALTFEGTSSWLVGAGRAWHGAQGPAPELMRQLPADATSLGYLRQMPKKSTERLAKVVGELGAGALESTGVPRATADRVARSLSQVFSADRTVVHAAGSLAAEGKTGAHGRWTLVGVDQERNQVLDILDGFAAGLAAKQIDIEPRHRPHLARKTLKLGAGLSAVVYEWRLPESVVDALEEGTEQLSAAGAPAAGASGVQELKSGYLAVMAAGKTTWIALAADRDGLTESLQKATSDISRVGQGAEFAELLERPALGASYVRLAGLVDQMAGVVDERTAKVAREALRMAPHRGAFGIITTFSLESGPMTQFVLHTRVPDEFLTDTAALVLALSADHAAHRPAKP